MRTAERLKAFAVAAVNAVVVEIVVAVAAAAAAEFDVGSAAAGHDAAMSLSRWWETWAVVNL